MRLTSRDILLDREHRPFTKPLDTTHAPPTGVPGRETARFVAHARSIPRLRSPHPRGAVSRRICPEPAAWATMTT